MNKLPVFPPNVVFSDDAEKDFMALDKTQQTEVAKGIIKVSTNPEPKPKGYGNPLRGELTGYCKIKFLKSGIRVVYKHVRTSNGMLLIVISMRNDNEVYNIAATRIKKFRKNR